MPQAKIQTPDGRIITLEVPEGATEQQILDFVKSQDLSQFQTEATVTDIKTPTEQVTAVQEAAQVEEPQGTVTNLAAVPIGAIENIVSMVSGGVTDAGAIAANLLGATQEELGFDSAVARQFAKELEEGGGFQPRTQAGQNIQRGIAEALSPVMETATEFGRKYVLAPNVAGLPGIEPNEATSLFEDIENRGFDAVADKVERETGSPLLTQITRDAPALATAPFAAKTTFSAATRSPRQARKLVADQIRQGNPNTDLVTKMLNDRGQIVTNRNSKRALKVLEKDLGDIKGPQTVSVLENMSEASKTQVKKMLDIVEKGRKEPIFAQTNRPADVLGESIARRARAIKKINEDAGKKIGSIAKNNKGKAVDINPSVARFLDELTDLGVTFNRGDDGWVTPDFSRSRFVGGSQKDLTVLINDLLDPEVDFQKAHRLKRTIRDNVNFDKGGTGQLSGDSEKLLKDLSRGIDDTLDSLSPEYKKANERFAKTIQIKEDFDKLAGKDVDLGDPEVFKALGGKARRLDSNAVSRVPIEKLINDSEKALGDLGVTFKDDILGLNHVLTNIENSFKIEPAGSFQGRIQRAGANIAQGVSPEVAATQGILERITKLNEPDFNKKMSAYRLLTRQDK
jgi:hypothetical protein